MCVGCVYVCVCVGGGVIMHQISHNRNLGVFYREMDHRIDLQPSSQPMRWCSNKGGGACPHEKVGGVSPLPDIKVVGQLIAGTYIFFLMFYGL